MSNPAISAVLAQELDAIEGSQALLRAQLRTGQHFITDPKRYRAACLAAGLRRVA
jgi:hypothetical protein